MENVQIAHMTFLLHFCPFSREELVAEYLKQNPEQQGLGEAEDQGGQRIVGQGKDTKYTYTKCQLLYIKYLIHNSKPSKTKNPSKMPCIQLQLGVSKYQMHHYKYQIVSHQYQIYHENTGD